jgi:hypothetical protein
MALSSSMLKTSLIYNYKNNILFDACTCKKINYYIPPTLECSKCFGGIEKLAKYYRPNDLLNLDEYCSPCYNKLKRDEKAKWKQYINDVIYEEPMITCALCNTVYHSICVMANINNDKNSDFICPTCMANYKKKKDLLVYSNWENYVSPDIIHLKQTILSRKLENTLKDDTLFVRELLSDDNKKYFGLFQLQDGIYVFIFYISVFYGSPQIKTDMYLSYIDSIFYYTNRENRTHMYQTFILAIMDDARLYRNMKRLFLWAMPPEPDTSYFFCYHPKDQKVLPKDKLASWYLKLFERGKQEQIVDKSFNVYDFIIDGKITKLEEISIFDGDFLSVIPNIATTIPPPPPEENLFNLILTQSKDRGNQLLMCYLKEPEMVFDKYIDENIHYPFITSRESFLDNCSHLFLQFDTLRKAKHSSMMILYYLCNPTLNYESYLCHMCHRFVFNNQKIFSDENYDLCETCYTTNVSSLTGCVLNTPQVFDIDVVKDHVCTVDGRCLYCIKNGIYNHAKQCIDKNCVVLACHYHKKELEEKYRKRNKKRCGYL